MKSAGVAGWFDDERGARLVELARDAPGAIVELGTAWGKSISYVLDQTDRHVTCVDFWGTDPDYADEHIYPGTWESFNELLDFEGWRNRVTIIRDWTSSAAQGWDQPIGLLHIDAGHDYDSVLADYQNWSPHVVPGGSIVFDDYTTYGGVKRVVSEEVFPDAKWTDHTVIYCQWSARRAF